MHGVSPAVPEMPSVGSGKTKMQEEAQGGGKAVVFVPNKIGACRPAVSVPFPLLNSQIDLVPRENAQAYLKRLCPTTSTLPFRHPSLSVLLTDLVTDPFRPISAACPASRSRAGGVRRLSSRA